MKRYKGIDGRVYEADVFDLPDEFDYEEDSKSFLRGARLTIERVSQIEIFFGEPKRRLTEKERSRIKSEYAMTLRRVRGIPMYVGSSEQVIKVLHRKYDGARSYGNPQRIVYDMYADWLGWSD